MISKGKVHWDVNSRQHSTSVLKSVSTMSLLSARKSLQGLSASLSSLSISSARRSPMSAPFVQQVRTATKKVAGSRTNMKDSAGRRLGAKVAENEPVNIGQILMRQRGTRFYPGENTSIGKDHTIYATEPGFVRFYLDPFHPKRKFVGVALKPELRLPTPHFEPRVRRLGYYPIEDESKAAFEENNLPRKDHLKRPEIIKQLQEREAKRLERLGQYKASLKSIGVELSEEEAQIASERLLSIRNQIKNGIPLQQAQDVTTSIALTDLKLSFRKGEIEQSSFDDLKTQYVILSQKLASSVSFDNSYNLIPFQTEEQRLVQVKELDSLLKQLFDSRKGTKSRDEIKTKIHGSNIITPREKKQFISKYLKSVLPGKQGIVSPSTKKASVVKKWNYETERIDVVGRSKQAFAF